MTVVDRAVLTSPVLVTHAFSVVVTVGVGDAQSTVGGSVAVAAAVLVADWVTVATEG